MKENSFNFKFDKRLKKQFFSTVYFSKTTKILNKNKDISILQFTHFCDKKVKVCGIKEVIQLIKFCLPKKHLKKIEVYGFKDGDLVDSSQSILLIKGPYYLFSWLENIIDGILARRSSVATNCYELSKVVNLKNVIYMADRTDDYLLQPYDGYAAFVGGIRNFVTPAQIEFIKNNPSVNAGGTIPHALIQQFDGKLLDALFAYQNSFPNDNLVALIDYHNDVVDEIKVMSKKITNLYAVRIDTSKNLIDKSLPKKNVNYGINPNLVKLVRKTLDAYGFKKTKIIVSSGLNKQTIKKFIDQKAPVDIYGVGASLIERNVNFTADLVVKNDNHEAKFGRKLYVPLNQISKLKRYL